MGEGLEAEVEGGQGGLSPAVPAPPAFQSRLHFHKGKDPGFRAHFVLLIDPVIASTLFICQTVIVK